MDTSCSNSNSNVAVEEVRSSSVGPIINGANSGAACRQSPKRTTPSTLASPSASLLLRNSLSPANILPTTLPRKIMSKNHNNTTYPTSFPTNLAELQLFRVMQNSSLLYYYDTLLEMGGDDVQQLCDAGEEEFLEIMSLVGMASKPLHVRRLQKSLQEWVTNPAKFKLPLSPGDDFEIERNYYSIEDAARTLYSSSPASPGVTLNKRPYSPLDNTSCPPSSSSSPGSTTTSTPTLLESQISKLAIAAERLSKHLPQFEPKPQNTKKKMCKELELVMSMPDSDPRRMDEIRRYAAIYGRFDCKRKPEKPLTLHEVSVNEAAAQICRFVPALLTRRDELFPLARQIVKDAGCHYSKTQSFSLLSSSMKSGNFDKDLVDLAHKSVASISSTVDNCEGPSSKKSKFSDNDSECEELGQKRQALYDNSKFTSLPLIIMQQKTMENYRRNSSFCNLEITSEEETDMPYPTSNSSSPLHDLMESNANTIEDPSEACEADISMDDSKYSPKVQVVASRGDNIIAVANPALSLSSSVLPVETLTD